MDELTVNVWFQPRDARSDLLLMTGTFIWGFGDIFFFFFLKLICNALTFLIENV